MPTSKLRSSISSLPDTPGVYLFFGPDDQLLYVGKSKTLRSRIRAHFSSREERWLCRRIRRIEVRQTPGELGALLLESKLIKELRPMHNVAAKRRRRIVIARRIELRGGYTGVALESVDHLTPSDAGLILGIFKHTTQAKEYLASIAQTHRLCPKLLRIEQPRGHCFSYHLGRCNGACVGEEHSDLYNKRLEEAFEERRIKAWPFEGSVIIEERSESGLESFFIDNWCLLASSRIQDDQRADTLYESHRFDYDSYKILYSFLSNRSNATSVKILARNPASLSAFLGNRSIGATSD
jgi:DNA polymerase-3 subunit epsilon